MSSIPVQAWAGGAATRPITAPTASTFDTKLFVRAFTVSSLGRAAFTDARENQLPRRFGLIRPPRSVAGANAKDRISSYRRRSKQPRHRCRERGSPLVRRRDNFSFAVVLRRET